MANEFRIKNGLKVHGIVEVGNQTGSTNTASIKEVTGGSSLSSTGTLTLSSNNADYITLDGGGYLDIKKPTIFDTRIFGTTSGYTALYSYTSETLTATSSAASVYGADISAVLGTGAYNSTANDGLIGCNIITAAYGNAGTSVASARGVRTYVSEQSNGTIVNGIGYDSEFYGSFTNFYGFRQRPSTFGTVTNAYGFYSEIPAGSTSYNFYAAGTAQNYFAGNVGIGITVPTEKLDISGNIKASGSISTTGTTVTAGYNADFGGSVRVAGSILATGDIAGNSDARLKDNVTVIENALENVTKLRGVTYNRNDLPNYDRRYAGVIAQEVETVFPEVVSTAEDGIKSVAYGNMVSILIEAIKDLKIIVENQQQEINILKGKIQ